MEKQCRNIYQIAREATGFTQERASELLDISVESLRAYESGKRIPPDKVVIKMIEIYNATYLAYQHLKTSAEVGQKYLPDISIQSLPISILQLQKEIKNFSTVECKLIEIGADGVINDSELKDWEMIIKELDDIANAIMALKFSKR